MSQLFRQKGHDVDLSHQWEDRDHGLFWTLDGHDTAQSWDEEGDPIDVFPPDFDFRED